MNSSIIVSTDIKDIKISKLPIIYYSEVLKQFKKLTQFLPKYFTGQDQITSAYIIEILPELIETALPELLDVIKIAINDQLTSEELKQLGISEITNIVIAVVEINDYSNVFNKVKKALAQYQTNPTQSIKAE